MPIGLVNDEDFLKEIKNDNNSNKPNNESQVITGVVESPSAIGRSSGDKNVPEVIREIIAEESVDSGRVGALEIARQFGISDSSVSAYSNGSTSTASYNKPKESLLKKINSRKLFHSNRAQKVLTRALDHITDEKLANAKPIVLAGVARHMSAIVKDMEPSNNNPFGNTDGKPQIVIYAPRIMNESSLGDPIIVNE